MKNTLLVFILLNASAVLFAQNPEKPKLITGPVIGAVTKNSAKLWIAYRGNGQNMLSLQDTVDKTIYHPTGYKKLDDHNGNVTLTMTFTGLQPNHTYKAIYIPGILSPRPKCLVRTLNDSTVNDFSFLFGSCAFLQTGFTRIAFPGLAVRIFGHMKREKTDFMVWLGDNVYYLGKQYNSFEGMFLRNLGIRNGFLSLSEFLAKQPNYAIWDDHDYGWNDSDKKFPLKDSAMVVFKGFWPNPYDDRDTMVGNYFTFHQYDAEFFMTDDRWYRDPEGDTAGDFLGAAQLKWLEDSLLASDATFKFVCIGSQVLNDCYNGECYAKYPVERNKLFDFIVQHNIKGVIFLTGDKHYSELSKRVWKGYPLYDFTSSPITSVVVPVKYIKGYYNTYSIPSTEYYKRNYGKISLSGPADNRICKMEIFGKGGKQRWEYTINANDIEKK